MNSTRLSEREIRILSIYGIFSIVSCTIVIVLVGRYIVLPAIRKPEMTFSNTQVRVTSDGDVTLWTVVNTFLNGESKPLTTLSVHDFYILEQHENQEKQAQILQAKPNNSPVQVIILIDISGSMGGETSVIGTDGIARKKLDVTKEAVLSFWNKLVVSGVASINGEPSVVAFLPFAGDRTSFLERSNGDIWFPTLPESQAEINQAIDALEAGGDTPLFDAVLQAIDTIQSTDDDKYKLIFCLTDGVNNYGVNNGANPDDLLVTQLQTNNIPVITVGYGANQDYRGDVLEQISSLSGAGGLNKGYFDNVTPTNISSVFERLVTDLNNVYEIRWTSAFPKPGNRVKATIQATYRARLGRISTSEIREYVIPGARR